MTKFGDDETRRLGKAGIAAGASSSTRGLGEQVKAIGAGAARMARNGGESLLDAGEGIAESTVKGVERATGIAAAIAKDPDIAVKFVKDKTSAAKNAVASVFENSDQYVARAKEAAVGGASAVVDGAKNPKKTMQTVREAGHGFHRGLADSAKGVSGHLLVGGEDFRELNARIYFQCEEYKSLESSPPVPGQVTDGSGFLDAVLAGGDAARVALKGEIPEEVLQAYSLQYPNVTESFKEKINRFSEEQVRGLVAGVKGKLFEIQYLDHLNGGVLPEGYHAMLAESAVQPGWDISVTGPDSGLAHLLQLKATDSVERVKLALLAHPDIQVVVPSELHAELVMRGYSEHVVDSHILHADLLDQMDDASDIAEEGFGDPSPVVLALLAFSSYRDDTLSAFERSRSFGSRSGNYMLAYLAGLAADTATGGLPLVSMIASVTMRAVVGKGSQKLRTRDAMQYMIVANESVLTRLRVRRLGTGVGL
jgi:hypothetical protein